MVTSVDDGSAHNVKLTGERTSDVTPWKRVGKWVQGRRRLFDLGYCGFHLFDRIDANGGFFLSRAKTNFNPVLVATSRKRRGASIDVVGKRLLDVLPRLHRGVLDVEVEVEVSLPLLDGLPAAPLRHSTPPGAWPADACPDHHLPRCDASART